MPFPQINYEASQQLETVLNTPNKPNHHNHNHNHNHHHNPTNQTPNSNKSTNNNGTNGLNNTPYLSQLTTPVKYDPKSLKLGGRPQSICSSSPQFSTSQSGSPPSNAVSLLKKHSGSESYKRVLFNPATSYQTKNMQIQAITNGQPDHRKHSFEVNYRYFYDDW